MNISSEYGLRSALAFLRFGVADVDDLTVRDLGGGHRGPVRLIDRSVNPHAHCMSRVPLAFHDPEDRVIDRLFNESPTNEEALNLIRPHNWRAAEQPSGEQASAERGQKLPPSVTSLLASRATSAGKQPLPQEAEADGGSGGPARADDDAQMLRSVSEEVSTSAANRAAQKGHKEVPHTPLLDDGLEGGSASSAASAVSSTQAEGETPAAAAAAAEAAPARRAKARRRTTIIRFRGSSAGSSVDEDAAAAVAETEAEAKESAAATPAGGGRTGIKHRLSADLTALLSSSADTAVAVAVAAAATATASAFTREDPSLPSTTPAPLSSITALLRPVTGEGEEEGEAVQRRVRPARQGDAKYTVFLPERKFRDRDTNEILSFELVTFKRSTVRAVLIEILEEFREVAPTLCRRLAEGTPLAEARELMGDASCYQLAMHEENGMPDTDMPHLDLSQNIGGFGEEEFCLREIGAKFAALAAKQGAEGMGSSANGGVGGSGANGGSNGSGGGGRKLSVSSRISKMSGRGGKVITVRDGDTKGQIAGGVRTFAVKDGDTVQGIITKLRDRRGMFMFDSPFELRLKPTDMRRLAHVLDRLDAGTKLTSLIELGVEQLYAFPREFADTKEWKPRAHGFMHDVSAARREESSQRESGDSGTTDESSVDNESSAQSMDSTFDEGLEMASIADDVEYKRRLDRPRPEEFELQYTEHTLSIYQEWEVVKINDRGRRQKRILGVDTNTVHNKKLESSNGGMWGAAWSSATRRPTRNVDDIKDIDFDDDIDEQDEGVRSRFHITFREVDDVFGRDAVLRYDALCSETAAYIVHKIKFIMTRQMSRVHSQQQLLFPPPSSSQTDR